MDKLQRLICAGLPRSATRSAIGRLVYGPSTRVSPRHCNRVGMSCCQSAESSDPTVTAPLPPQICNICSKRSAVDWQQAAPMQSHLPSRKGVDNRIFGRLDELIPVRRLQSHGAKEIAAVAYSDGHCRLGCGAANAMPSLRFLSRR